MSEHALTDDARNCERCGAQVPACVLCRDAPADERCDRFCLHCMGEMFRQSVRETFAIPGNRF